MSNELSFDELRELERQDRLAQAEHNKWARQAQREEHEMRNTYFEKQIAEFNDVWEHRRHVEQRDEANKRHQDEMRQILNEQTAAWLEVAAAIRELGKSSNDK
jgi:hypothetical protein